MTPLDEPSARTRYASKITLLQMEKEKAADKMMNRIRQLFPAKELDLEKEEVVEGQTYDESYQEDPDKSSHVEDLDDTFNKDEALAFCPST
jgi:hypothetical protein